MSAYSEIIIRRERQGTGCILGKISIKRPFGGGDVPFLAHSLELPWKQNANKTSCILPGRYSAKIRTDGARGWRIELKDVPKRTVIQIHAGNRPSEIEGCILPGLRVSGDGSVTSSRKAMKALKDEVYKYSKTPTLLVVVEDAGAVKDYSVSEGEMSL